MRPCEEEVEQEDSDDDLGSEDCSSTYDALAILVFVSLNVLIVTCLFFAGASHDSVVSNDALPLGKPLREFASAPRLVDIVYTWVNGSQVEFQHALRKATSEGRLPYEPDVSRYRDDGLLQYSLRSLLQADALMRSVRHVYIVSSGEVPSFLPAHAFRPVDMTEASSTDPTCGAAVGFTRTPISMHLKPLVERSRRGRSAGGPIGGGEESRLFVVPHAAIFPDAAAELPTFNSNAILCSLHRLPGLSDWFLYSDDDTVITQHNISMDAWWDATRHAQRLYMIRGHGVHRQRRRVANNWEQAMTFMSGLLDDVTPEDAFVGKLGGTGSRPPPGSLPQSGSRPPGSLPQSGSRPPPHSPPSPPPPDPTRKRLCEPVPVTDAPPFTVTDAPPFTVTDAPPLPATPPVRNSTGTPTGRAATDASSAAAPATALAKPANPPPVRRMRYYARPQHMPVLMSRDLVLELERRWASEFVRTRRHRLRLGDELELNFLYHHYLRAMRLPVTASEPGHVAFTYSQHCAAEKGKAHAFECKKAITDPRIHFATFNDDASTETEFKAGLASLNTVLNARFGTFDDHTR